MQDRNWQRVTADAFNEGDVYIDYPYERAKFRWELETKRVYRRFYGEQEVEIPHSSKLFHEAQSGGWVIDAEAYFQDEDAKRHAAAGGLARALEIAMTPTCEVCGGDPAQARDSALGRKPYLRCDTCVEEGAENITAICLKIFLAGGLEEVEKIDAGAWWPYRVRSHVDGRYIDWPEIRAAYPQHSRHFRKNF